MRHDYLQFVNMDRASVGDTILIVRELCRSRIDSLVRKGSSSPVANSEITCPVSAAGSMKFQLGIDDSFAPQSECRFRLQQRGVRGYIISVIRPVTTSAAAQTRLKLNHTLRRIARPHLR